MFFRSQSASQFFLAKERETGVKAWEMKGERKKLNANEPCGILKLTNLLMNKGGKFLKKLWCCVGGSITR